MHLGEWVRAAAGTSVLVADRWNKQFEKMLTACVHNGCIQDIITYLTIISTIVPISYLVALIDFDVADLWAANAGPDQEKGACIPVKSHKAGVWALRKCGANRNLQG